MAANEQALAMAKEQSKYKWGFSSDIESDFAPKGLNEDTVRFISAKKAEPEWMLEWRLKAFRLWLGMEHPDWAKLSIPPIDYQDAFYYAAPRTKPTLKSLDELDPEILLTYQKLGIPIEEQKVLAGVEGARKVAVDAVFDSVSVATTFREELKRAGVIFLSISEAIREYPDLVKKYLGAVVPVRDNFFACLNSAVFSDGTFVYVPEGVRCPMELSTYFRINAENSSNARSSSPRRGRTSPISKAAPRRSATRTSSTPPSSNWSHWKMRRSNIPPSRTGIRATRTARAASTTSSPSARTAGATAPRCRGRRWKPARRSRGNIRPACFRGRTASVSSIPSRSPTTGSRPIPARR